MTEQHEINVQKLTNHDDGLPTSVPKLTNRGAGNCNRLYQKDYKQRSAGPWKTLHHGELNREEEGEEEGKPAKLGVAEEGRRKEPTNKAELALYSCTYLLGVVFQ